MKKLLCLLLAALLLSACMGSALADVSATYQDGKVTVTTDESGFWEITIDSTWAGRWVGHLMPSNTFSMPLEDGEHTVSIYNPDSGAVASSTFWVGEGQPDDNPTQAPDDNPTGQPDAGPTAAPGGKDSQPADDGKDSQPAPEYNGPLKLENVRYATGVVYFQVNGLHGYAEIWIDGNNTGYTVNENGEQCAVQLLDEGKHTLALYVPAADEVDSADFSAEDFTPKAEALQEGLENLMKNDAGKILGAGLSIDRDETSYLLRVSVDGNPNAILTLTKELISVLLKQGLNVIEYVNGKAALRIDLTKISDQWFETEKEISAYSFVLNVSEESAEVTVYAETGEEKVEASALYGVTLIRGDKRTVVKRNGIY